MRDSSESHRRFLQALILDGKIKRNHALSRKYSQSLIDLEIVTIQREGRSDYIVVTKPENLHRYIENRFPGGLDSSPNSRLEGVMLRGNSKLGGNASSAILVCRVFSNNSTTNVSVNPKDITEEMGLFSVSINSENYTQMRVSGKVSIVENLDVFMKIECFIESLDIAIYSGGILDSRIIGWLNECDDISQIIHAGDYDSTGLKEFIRYERELKHNVEFYLNEDIELGDFRTYGRSDLVGKGRNLGLMDSIRKHQSDDKGFNKSIEYILESGNGLEQEFLLSFLN